jgi:DNA modification methylase
VLIDGQGGIIAGHGRVMAAKKLGIEEVPCIELSHLTDAQRRAYVIADNKLALNAGWDDEMLRVEFQELQDLGFDVELTGFSMDEINALTVEEVEGLTDEDAVPEAPETPVSVLGDVWLLGNHRLMCGDSTSIDAVEKLMDGHKADMVFTDPPYNVAYEGKTKESMTIQNDSMATTDFKIMMDQVFANLYLAMHSGAPIYVTCPLEDGVFLSSYLGSGLKLQSILVWVKNTMVMGRKDYHYKHEPIMYGWKEGAAHFWQGGRDKTTVISCDKPPRNGEHPTMKPVELIEILLGNSGRIGAITLDLFGGSGSTLIACEKTGRTAYLMELDEKYVDVIIKRWQDFAGKQAIHEATGKTYAELSQ